METPICWEELSQPTSIFFFSEGWLNHQPVLMGKNILNIDAPGEYGEGVHYVQTKLEMIVARTRWCFPSERLVNGQQMMVTNINILTIDISLYICRRILGGF